MREKDQLYHISIFKSRLHSTKLEIRAEQVLPCGEQGRGSGEK
jgi:hypothetical protein